MRDKKNILIGALLIIILVMALGYILFFNELSINEKDNNNWGVEVTSITSEVIGDANAGVPTFTTSTATFDTTLKKLGDSATYTITIENKGDINASLKNIILAPREIDNENTNILYEILNEPAKDSVLAPGENIKIKVKVSCDPMLTEEFIENTRTFNVMFEYVQVN